MNALPIIRWPGGKRRLAKHIVPFISAESGYIEAFAGGLAILLAKEKSKLEVVNDLNGDLVTLYRVAKHHPDALAAELRLLPNSRDFIRHSQELLATSALTDLQRSALFLHANRTSFCASGTSYAVAKNPGSAIFSSRSDLIERLEKFSYRMSQVSIESMDYRRLLATYDHPGNLFFLDPPYLDADVANYRGWTEIEMGQFRSSVEELRGKWIVTVDSSDLNRALWHGHDIQMIVSPNGIGNQGKNPGRTFGEMIVFSPGLRGPGKALAAA